MRRLFLVVLAAVLVTPGAEAATRSQARRAERQVQGALAALTRADLAAAYKAAERAVELDADNMQARLLRGLILAEAAEITADAPLATRMKGSALEDFKVVMRADPDAPSATAALAAIERLGAGELLPLPETTCSPAAHAYLDEAEARFSTGDQVAAEAAYARATTACPANALWWTWYGDVYFVQSEYARAAATYQKALDLEPCLWTAHRFLGDAQQRGGDDSGAYGSFLRAVACNPNYDEGWKALAQLSALHGAHVERLRIGTLSAETAALLQVPDGPGALDDARVAELAGAVYRRTIDAAEGSALTRRRLAVRASLDWIGAPRLLAPPDGAGLEGWRVFAEAERTGELDEAILVGLLDRELVEELRTRQGADLSRIVGFLSRHVAPLADVPLR